MNIQALRRWIDLSFMIVLPLLVGCDGRQVMSAEDDGGPDGEVAAACIDSLTGRPCTADEVCTWAGTTMPGEEGYFCRPLDPSCWSAVRQSPEEACRSAACGEQICSSGYTCILSSTSPLQFTCQGI